MADLIEEENGSRTSVAHKSKGNLITRFKRRDRSEVSEIIKYLIFGFNIIFWLLGVLVIAIGIWAVSQSNFTSNMSALGNILFDPIDLFFIVGSIVFVIGLFGCIGALRENIWLLIVYITLMVITLLLWVIAAILLFACKDWLTSKIVEIGPSVIAQYNNDINVQNLIDWVQGTWLLCCGLTTYKDWAYNMYFNCSSPGVQACGVPYSCCVPSTRSTIQNLQCGNGIMSLYDPTGLIYMSGCVANGNAWAGQYVIPIAAIVTVVVVFQALIICFSVNLFRDIRAQKAKWKRLA